MSLGPNGTDAGSVCLSRAILLGRAIKWLTRLSKSKKMSRTQNNPKSIEIRGLNCPKKTSLYVSISNSFS